MSSNENVSNTGPIIALAKVKKLALLKELASDVVILVAVWITEPWIAQLRKRA